MAGGMEWWDGFSSWLRDVFRSRAFEHSLTAKTPYHNHIFKSNNQKFEVSIMSEDKIIKVGAGAVIIKDGKTLLAKRKGAHADGCYGSIGGHVEFGESPMETVKREATEELGVEIGNLKFVSCWKR
ncbi:NUDIX hydrolase [Patescibacteria group bacterium]|nr:MAG: NUDIX hydrolase [Patescibacteria group bacterium]